MAEICTPPIITYNDEGNPSYTFNEHHTWRDVARWIAQNPVDLEEMIYILTDLRTDLDEERFVNAKRQLTGCVDDFIGCFDE
jgi:hypothetical protein